jgi:hypothetical protein
MLSPYCPPTAVRSCHTLDTLRKTRGDDPPRHGCARSRFTANLVPGAVALRSSDAGPGASAGEGAAGSSEPDKLPGWSPWPDAHTGAGDWGRPGVGVAAPTVALLRHHEALRRGPAGSHPLGQVWRRHGPGVEIALGDVASCPLQRSSDLCGLHALTNDVEA